ncbi:MAG: type II secretion system protein GspM [Thiohalocapsa sp.]
MSDWLRPPLSRILAVAILLCVLLVGWYAILSPVIGMATERQSRIDALQERLAYLHATVARIPELERRTAAAKAQLDAAGGLWTGASDAAIAAALQEQLRQVVANSGGTVKSIANSANSASASDNELQTIKVRLSVDGTLDTLQQTLAAVETSRPPMFVDSLQIAGPAQFSAEKQPMLTLDFEISAFMRKTAP